MTLAMTCDVIQGFVDPPGQRYFQPLRELVLAVHAKAQAGHRDADLSRRDEPILLAWFLEDALDTAGATIALVGARLDSGTWRADDGEFRGHEEPVHDHKQEHDSRRDEDVHHSWSSLAAGTSRLTTTESTARSMTRSTSNS